MITRFDMSGRLSLVLRADNALPEETPIIQPEEEAGPGMMTLFAGSAQICGNSAAANTGTVTLQRAIPENAQALIVTHRGNYSGTASIDLRAARPTMVAVYGSSYTSGSNDYRNRIYLSVFDVEVSQDRKSLTFTRQVHRAIGIPASGTSFTNNSTAYATINVATVVAITGAEAAAMMILDE